MPGKSDLTDVNTIATLGVFARTPFVHLIHRAHIDQELGMIARILEIDLNSLDLTYLHESHYLRVWEFLRLITLSAECDRSQRAELIEGYITSRHLLDIWWYAQVWELYGKISRICGLNYSHKLWARMNSMRGQSENFHTVFMTNVKRPNPEWNEILRSLPDSLVNRSLISVAPTMVMKDFLTSRELLSVRGLLALDVGALLDRLDRGEATLDLLWDLYSALHQAGIPIPLEWDDSPEMETLRNRGVGTSLPSHQHRVLNEVLMR